MSWICYSPTLLNIELVHIFLCLCAFVTVQFPEETDEAQLQDFCRNVTKCLTLCTLEEVLRILNYEIESVFSKTTKLQNDNFWERKKL